MSTATTIDLAPIARELGLHLRQIEATVALLDDGNTVPFITRYRKDHTGGLDEVQIRAIESHVAKARMLADRKQTILRSIESQGKLTPELAAEIAAARTTKRLDDLYLPYKPKKQTLATTARERGLEPLAKEILAGEKSGAELDVRAAEFISEEKGVPTAAEALLGAGHIIAEQFSEGAELRQRLRKILKRTGKLVSKRAEGEVADEKKIKPYADYFDYSEELSRMPAHRVLAINRGEWAKALRVKLEADFAAMGQTAEELLVAPDHPNAEFLRGCVRDALDRLVIPSLEREMRRELTDNAEEHATHVFAKNLRNLLLQPPVAGRRVLAVDPGFRSGCKLAALDEFGNLLAQGIVHVIGKGSNRHTAKLRMAEFLRTHQLSVIVIGNGTACRETEQVVAELITGQAAPEPAHAAPAPLVAEPVPAESVPAEPVASESEAAASDAHEPAAATDVGEPSAAEVATATPADAESVAGEPAAVDNAATDPAACESAPSEPQAAPVPAPSPPVPLEPVGPFPEVSYVIVNEAGASVYSTSGIGREEFPEFDASLRGAISIGRRLLDPLSELVKIEPANIGVGMYQHDVKAKHLRDSLDSVVESCVNYVGVDLNTASPSLLRYVSGLNQLRARQVYDHRAQHGPFRSREQLKLVAGIGEGTYIQAAGFLRITGGDVPLDSTWIHPESYEVAGRVLEKLGFQPSDLASKDTSVAIAARTGDVDIDAWSQELGVGTHLLRDILTQLGRPGRDPRESLPPPIFKHGILKLEDLSVGMELQGTVLNVVDFGAFVDIGLHDSGLVHVSQIANRYIRDPHEVVAVGDIVKVWVSSIDKDRRRVGLTMIAPGTPKPNEQRDRPRRRRGGGGGGQRGGPPRPAGAGVGEGQTPTGEGAAPGGPGGAPGDGSSRGPRRDRGRRPPRRPPQPQGDAAAATTEGAPPVSGDAPATPPRFERQAGSYRGSRPGGQGAGQGGGAGRGGSARGGGSGGGSREGGGRPGGGRPGGQGGGGGGEFRGRRDNRRRDKPPGNREPQVYTSRKPKESIPITKEMEEGKAPLRTFGDLMQFFQKKQDPPEQPPAASS